MFEFKIIVGGIAAILALLSFLPYIWGTLIGRIKPHAFSYLVWGILGGSTCILQTMQQGGAGAWSSGVLAIGCLVIFGLALQKGDRKFTKFDWIALTSALIALALWWITSNPILAAVLLTLSDVLGFLPTFRKDWRKPFEDSVLLFVSSTTEYTLSIIALQHYSVSTWLYPATLILVNLSFISMLLIRRGQAPLPPKGGITNSASPL